jgi:hypothetical protein
MGRNPVGSRAKPHAVSAISASATTAIKALRSTMPVIKRPYQPSTRS